MLDDAAGLVTDPLNAGSAAKTASDALDRALIQLKLIQEETDRDIRDYLSEIDSIARLITESIEQTGQRAENTLLELAARAEALEERIYQDAIDIVYRVQCASEVFATDSLKRALADAVNTLRAADPNFTFFGLRVAGTEIEPIDIPDPDIAYRAVKQQRQARLANLTATDDAYIIVSTYLNLARLARLTQCHYIDQNQSIIFVRDYLEFERLNKPWTEILRVD